METALGNLYGNIVSNLTDNVSELKTIDIDMGHLKDEGAKLPYELPAAIVKIENVYYEKFDISNRLGVAHVRIRIVYAYENDTENYVAAHNVRTEVLLFFELIHNIKEAINGITGGYHSNLYLINESHLRSNTGEMKWIYCLDYLCNLYSNDADYIDTGDIIFTADLLNKYNELIRRTDLSVVRIGDK